MKMQTKSVGLSVPAIALVTALAGCGYSPLTSREGNPIIIDKLNTASWVYPADLGTVATKADRRLALIRVGTSPGMDAKLMKIGHICAEPPPDVAENTARLLAAAVKADVGERGFGGVFSDEEAVVAQMLLVRSQGVQFARDGFFSDLSGENEWCT